MLQHKVPKSAPPPGLEGFRVEVKNTFLNVVEDHAGNENASLSAPEIMHASLASPPRLLQAKSLVESFVICDQADVTEAMIIAAIKIQALARRLQAKKTASFLRVSKALSKLEQRFCVQADGFRNALAPLSDNFPGQLMHGRVEGTRALFLYSSPPA